MPSFFPENNQALASDDASRSLKKINDLLYGIGLGVGVWCRFSAIATHTVTVADQALLVWDDAALGRSGLFRGTLAQSLTTDGVDVINGTGGGQWIRVTSF